MISRQTPLKQALTFDDVLLSPKRTSARSRADVDTSTRITPRIQLRAPIVSANTPWCTGARMAAAMARLGALGIIHRMCTPEREAAAVAEAKSAAWSPREDPSATVDGSGRLRVGAAVGATTDYLERAGLVVAAGADVLVVDVAHGHADYTVEAVQALTRRFPEVEVIAGNVATADGARDLIDAGASAIKVGIGPGGVCTTRVVTGCGVPQLTALLDCVEHARTRNVPIIADGGIRSSGDIVKALAAGASAVMLGSLLAGADESEALAVEIDGERVKITTGFASIGVQLTLKKQRGEPVSDEDVRNYTPEGVEATFRCEGPVAGMLGRRLGGVRSGFSYSGALNLAELWERAEFLQISPSGQAEGRPHVLDVAPRRHPSAHAR